MESYCQEAEHVYAVTLSSHLSGSYNSAELGKSLYHEKYGEKQIHVVDSESASGGEATDCAEDHGTGGERPFL